MPFGPFGFLLELFFLAGERQDEKRAQAQADAVLDELAAACGGSVQRGFLRSPRVCGQVAGRDVTLFLRGSSSVEVRCPAPHLDLAAARPSWLARLFGAPELRYRGPDAQRERVTSLFHRYGGQRLRVEAGELVGSFSAGRDPRAVLELTRALAEIAGSSAEPSVSVTPRPQAEPATDADLRCPFCHDGLGADALVVSCGSCDAPYHPSCFEESDGCAIPGCDGRKARGGRVPAKG